MVTSFRCLSVLQALLACELHGAMQVNPLRRPPPSSSCNACANMCMPCPVRWPISCGRGICLSCSLGNSLGQHCHPTGKCIVWLLLPSRAAQPQKSTSPRRDCLCVLLLKFCFVCSVPVQPPQLTPSGLPRGQPQPASGARGAEGAKMLRASAVMAWRLLHVRIASGDMADCRVGGPYPAGCLLFRQWDQRWQSQQPPFQFEAQLGGPPASAAQLKRQQVGLRFALATHGR